MMAEAAQKIETPEPSVQPTETENKATDLGWKPKDQWEGNPEEWRSAKEFVDRQSLFDKIDNLKSTIWELKRDYKSVYETISKAERAKYDSEIMKLKAERKQAAREGDTEKVVEISDQLEQVQATATQPVVTQQGPDPVYAEWEQKNKWYRDKPELKNDADDFGRIFRMQNPNSSMQEMLDYVTTKMRKIYPEDLGVKSKLSAANVDGGGNTQRPANRSGKFTENDLTSTEAEVMRKMVKLKIYGNIPEADAKQKYIASLMKAKEK